MKDYKQYYTSSLFNIKNDIDFTKKTTFINIFTNKDLEIFNKIKDKIVIYNSEIEFFNYLNIVNKVIENNVKIYSDNIKIRDYLFKNQVKSHYIDKQYDMFNLNYIDDNILSIINKNINNFNSFIKEYKNILFICGDYPSYGGAATNCNHLENYYKNKGHNTYSYYHNYVNYNINRINFNPDIIILKSFIKTNLKEKFKCPIIYLIGGIYKNELDKYYFKIYKKEEQNKYINNDVINQIKNSDYSFSNSSHTQEILNKYYNLDTELFYSSFIQFKDKNVIVDSNFNNRKYDYGLIVSNFDRKIKNVEKSIQFLKNKKNVILIGKNSNKYASYGFECVDLIDNDKMIKYYKNIKYIVQDSFYESCSNVKIEGLFYGCEIAKKNIVISSTQYAGYGGAATNAYQLIKYFRKNNNNVFGVFFHNDLNVNYDPDNIGGVYLYPYKYDKNKIRMDSFKYLNKNPDICLVKNYLAPQFCKDIFNCYTVYLVSGINHFRFFFSNKTATEVLDKNFIINNNFEPEIITNTLADKIILNSNLTKQIFIKIYPQFVNKIANEIVDTTFAIQKHELKNKIYDIIICCSILTRKDKNNLFLIDVLNDKRLDKFNKIIIGSDNKLYNSIPNSLVLDIQPHYNSIDYLNKSKILLFPSLFDSNSNTVREAAFHNCMPIITRNIGFYELFPSYLICDTFEIKEWVNKIIYTLEHYDEIVSNNDIFTNNNNINIEKLLY